MWIFKPTMQVYASHSRWGNTPNTLWKKTIQDLFYSTLTQVMMIILYTEEEVPNRVAFRLNFRLEINQSELITNGLFYTILCFQERLMLILTSNFAPTSIK